MVLGLFHGGLGCRSPTRQEANAWPRPTIYVSASLAALANLDLWLFLVTATFWAALANPVTLATLGTHGFPLDSIFYALFLGP